MKKHLFTLSGVLFTILSFGQVGINTENPKVTLDVSALRTTTGVIDGNDQLLGLQAPRITLAELTDNTATYGSDQKGALIYVTDVSGGNNNSPRLYIVAEGYYYFDGILWQQIGSGGTTSGDTTNDAWLNDASGSMVKVVTKADGISSRDAGTEFVVKDNGNVGIGTSSPDESAILELQTSNKGFLLPRVILNSINDITAISNPAKGLTVYNTNENALSGEGIYYNSGTSTDPIWSALSKINSNSGSTINKMRYLGGVNSDNILTVSNLSFRFNEPSGTDYYRYEIQMKVNSLPDGLTSITYRSNRIDFFGSSSNQQTVNISYSASEVSSGTWKRISYHSGSTATHSNLIHLSCDEIPVFLRLSTQEKFGSFWSMIGELY